MSQRNRYVHAPDEVENQKVFSKVKKKRERSNCGRNSKEDVKCCFNIVEGKYVFVTKMVFSLRG